MATAKREAEIAASGLTPLDYMLSVLRDDNADPKDRRWAAAAAAPYVHSRLATTTVRDRGKHEFRIRIVE